MAQMSQKLWDSGPIGREAILKNYEILQIYKLSTERFIFLTER